MTPLKHAPTEATAPTTSRQHTRPLRFACTLNPVKSEVSHLPADTEVSFVPMDAIREHGGIDLSQSRPIGTVLQGYSYFRDGDVVIAKITPCFENGKGSIAAGLANGIGFGTTELHVLRPGSEVDARFLFYVTLSHEFREAGTASMYGAGGQKRVSEEFLRDFVVAFPLREDQRRIADFLDHKTAEIDALIYKKERMIALLNERRQADITRFITKGLDPNAKLKASDSRWIGAVPSHWELKPLKHLTPDARPIMYGIVLPGPHVEGGVPIVKGGNCEPGRLRLELLSRTTPEIEATYARSRLRVGDIVYAIRGSIGAADMVPPEVEGANLTQDAARIAPRHGVNGKWLLHAVRSTAFFGQLDARATGATIRGINIFDLKRGMVPVPPSCEQAEIAEYLDRCLEWHTLEVSRLERSIALLAEYRRALISEAVAGRVSTVESSRSVAAAPSAIAYQSVNHAVGDERVLFPEVFEQPTDHSKPARTARPVPPAFKRAVLAAELILRMHDDPAFHKIKFQKTLFLAEHHLRLPSMETHYLRDAAGPHDNAAMRSIESQLRSQKWYNMRKADNQFVFDPMEKVGGHAAYFQRYWSECSDGLDALLTLLKPMKTLQAEIVATLYAAWNDFLIGGVEFDDAKIVREVLTNWNPAKERITEDRWHKALGWMREKGLVPTGFGEPTTKKGGGPA